MVRCAAVRLAKVPQEYLWQIGRSAVPEGTAAIDVQSVINGMPLSFLQKTVLAICFLVVAIDGFDTAVIGFLAPSIRSEWGTGSARLTVLMMAGLAGLLVGAFAFGPLSDWFGRKPILIVTCVLFGSMCWLSGFSDTVGELTVLRFLTGLGLGGAMPNAITLASEYSPDQRRGSLVTLMFCGFTVGMASSGIIAAVLIPAFGWRAVLVFGGVAPLLLAPVLLLLLPESIRFLALKGNADRTIAKILARMNPARTYDKARFIAGDAAPVAPIAQLFTGAMAWGTLLLWSATFMSLLVIYLVGNWLPLILTDAGLGKGEAALITTGFHIGGAVGGVVLGQLMDRLNENAVLTIAYLGGAVAIVSLGSVTGAPGLMTVAAFAAGLCVSGGQIAVQAVASGFYPTGARATGVSWMNGVGRSGSIVGSLAGGLALSLGWAAVNTITLLAIPAVLAALSIFAMGRVRPDRKSVNA